MSGSVLIAAPPNTRRSTLAAALRAAYFRVVEADPDNAVAAAQDTSVDLCLLDWPAPAPWAAFSPDAAVIALAPGSEAIAAQAYAAGADDFAIWPEDGAGALCTRLRALMRRQAMAAETAQRHEAGRRFGLGGHDEPGQGGVLAVIGAPPQETVARMGALAHDLGLALTPAATPDAALALAERGDVAAALVWSSEGDEAAAVSLANAVSSRGMGRNCAALVALSPGSDAAASLDLSMADWAGADAAPSLIAIRLRGLVARARAGDDLRRTFEAGLRLAATDPLTGLYNRRYAGTHLSRLCNRAAANARPLSLLMLDIDRFKAVNDAYGHDGGDRALCAFAARLKNNLRGGDLVARTGGDEFVIAAPGAGPEAAIRAAERVRRLVASAPFELFAGARVNLTVSIGVASVAAGEACDPADLMRAADGALYAAKTDGRDRARAAAALSASARTRRPDPVCGHSGPDADVRPGPSAPDPSATTASRPSTTA